MKANKPFAVTVKPFYITYMKGYKLVGDLYIPKTDYPLPVILMRTPYGKKSFNSLFDAVEVARMGFVVVVQHVRGRYESDGIFDPFLNEKSDSLLTVQWLRKQPWCNGQIYSIGVSYEGFTAMMCSFDPKLNAFASIASVSDIRNQWFFEGGTIRQAFVQAWSHSFAYTDTNRLSSEQKKEIQYLANDLTELYKLTMEEFPAGKYLPYYSSWIDAKNASYWDEVESCTTVNLNDTNGYYVGGWYDIFCEGTICDYQKAVVNTNKAQRLVIGPWSHNDLYSPLVGEVDFGIYSLKDVDQYDIIRWFSGIMKNEQVQTGVSIFVMGTNKWINMKDWPPGYSKKRMYFSSIKGASSLYGDGCLTWEAVSEPGSDSFIHDKDNPVPSLGGRCLDASTSSAGRGGPFNQKQLELREDVLLYTSEALKTELTIMGLVASKLSVLSSCDETAFHIKLVDVFPDGRDINILDSCIVTKQKKNIMYEIQINLGSTAYTFLAEHRIRCIISSSSFPRISINSDLLNSKVRQVVYWGGNISSWVELPIVFI
ncbi:MAG: putative hydrolase CocE/NonD family protein [Herbinix sp.]|jgi:putative CocE/NonD family hydrolase|nr:putative hydrolase CocE/NonD family protein [Herbinix sp.]